jgi:hypothetical protein
MVIFRHNFPFQSACAMWHMLQYVFLSFSLLGLLVFYYFRVHIPTTIISQRFNDIVISTPSLVSAIFFCEAATPYIIFLESNFSVDILNIAHVNYETRR